MIVSMTDNASCLLLLQKIRGCSAGVWSVMLFGANRVVTLFPRKNSINVSYYKRKILLHVHILRRKHAKPNRMSTKISNNICEISVIYIFQNGNNWRQSDAYCYVNEHIVTITCHQWMLSISELETHTYLSSSEIIPCFKNILGILELVYYLMKCLWRLSCVLYNIYVIMWPKWNAKRFTKLLIVLLPTYIKFYKYILY